MGQNHKDFFLIFSSEFTWESIQLHSYAKKIGMCKILLTQLYSVLVQDSKRP